MKVIISFLVILSLISCNDAWIIEFESNNYTYNYTLFMGEELIVPFSLQAESNFTGEVSLEIMSENENIVTLDEKYNINNILIQNGKANNSFVLKGVFLGITRIIFTLTETSNGQSSELQPLDVKVIRQQRIIDKIFTATVVILVALIYINFGCALDWSSLKVILRRPIGPIIGFFGQFAVMPTLSYFIGMLVFHEHPEMWLGLFFTGVSPAGGASNVWTCVLDGNVDLSVTMTTISTLAAFAMMPLWLFTLGPHIFSKARLGVPYEQIAKLAAALILPLGIGWLIQRFLPRLSNVLVRALKTFSAVLILFIVIFAIVTNLYLFKLATWRIAFAGLLLPWCGFVLGGALALLFRQPMRDVTAIAIETGVQNTGIAIFLLRFALPTPQDDLTTVVPVAIAVMTPLPLTVLYIYKRFCRRNKDSFHFAETTELTS